MPKYTLEREKIEVEQVAKSLLENGLNSAAVARLRGTTRQNESKKARQKSVQDCIKSFLNTSEFAKRWREQGEAGAFEAERSIGAAILVQKDGTLVKADDEGGITMPDHSTRHKFWRDLGLAAGFLLDKPLIDQSKHTHITKVIKYYNPNEETIDSSRRLQAA